MTDPRLVTYVNSINKGHESVLRLARSQRGEEAWVTVDFPAVFLILAGATATGRVISDLEYCKRMRESIQAAPGEKNWKDIFSEIFRVPDLVEEVSLAQEDDIVPERIYLMNAVVVDGTGDFKIPTLSVQLDAVQAWSLGKA